MLIALAVISYSNGKPIQDENHADSDDVKNLPTEVIDSEVNYEEAGNHFEGDMQMTPGEIRSLFAKTGLVDTRYRWLKFDGLVVVPYTIRAGNYSKNSLNIDKII